jgi:iron(III) transport system substrate-binding protein
MNSFRGKFGLIVMLLGVTLLVLAACGSSSDTEGSGTEGSKVSTENGGGGGSSQNEAKEEEQNSPFPAGIQAIIEAAKQEEKVVHFGLSADPSQTKELEEALKQYYGFEIKVEMLSGFHPQKASEIISAAKSGVPSGIDLFFSSVTTIPALQKEGLVSKVDWPELGIPEEYVSLSGDGVRNFDNFAAAIFYNTDSVSADEVPKSYDDLLLEKWKGKITTVRTANTFVYMLEELGEEYMDRFVQEIADQVVFSASFPDVLARVSSGEFPIALGSAPVQAVMQGAPIALAPIEPILILPWSHVILSDAQGPNLAKLLTYYFYSDEGQQFLAKHWGYNRTDSPNTPLAELAGGMETAIVREEFVDRSADKLQEYSKILGIE